MNNADIAVLFEKKGLRWTVQRQLVLNIVLERSGHLSAEEIHREVTRTFPSVNLSTVYRTLELLTEIGLIVEVEGYHDQRRYEMIHTNPHFHAMCKGCGMEIELENKLVQKLKDQIWDQYRIDLNLGHFVGLSVCSHCLGNYPNSNN